MIIGCVNPDYYGDNYCDDVNNNEACFFDGGDCCGSNVNTDYCNVCQCLEEGGGGSGGTTTPSGTTTGGACNQGWIADGYCDDINNNLACTYDGGDCCGCIVNTEACIECLCLEGAWEGYNDGDCCNQGWMADGYCDDINNNLACTYDGGDCCGANVNTNYCTECQCLE